MAFLLVLPKLPGQVRIFVSIALFRKKISIDCGFSTILYFCLSLFFRKNSALIVDFQLFYIFIFSGPWYSQSPFRSCWSNLVIKMGSKHRLSTSPGFVNLPFNLPKLFSISCGLESLKIKLELCPRSHTDILNECCKYFLSWRERFEFYRSTENTVTLGHVSRYLHFE